MSGLAEYEPLNVQSYLFRVRQDHCVLSVRNFLVLSTGQQNTQDIYVRGERDLIWQRYCRQITNWCQAFCTLIKSLLRRSAITFRLRQCQCLPRSC